MTNCFGLGLAAVAFDSLTFTFTPACKHMQMHSRSMRALTSIAQHI